jgi:hypothetical protein
MVPMLCLTSMPDEVIGASVKVMGARMGVPSCCCCCILLAWEMSMGCMPPTMATGVRLPRPPIWLMVSWVWGWWPWAGAGAIGWMVLGLFMRGGLGDGGAEPRSSPAKKCFKVTLFEKGKTS